MTAENELAIERLLDRHQKWLLQQPEMLLLWPQSRQLRRRVAELLASELLTIPHRVMGENDPPRRAMRRHILEELQMAQTQKWRRHTKGGMK